MSIQWRDGMAIDHGVIDHDHQTLIAIINEFCEAPLDRGRLLELQRIFDKLDRYTKVHFEREETLQRAANYPYRDAHHHEHLALIHEMEELRNRFADMVQSTGDVVVVSAAQCEDLAKLRATMAEFLRYWLVDHILKSDLRMKPYAQEMSRHSGGFAPLSRAAA